VDQKTLWEKLAQKNSRYYINSDYGKNITKDEFRQSGAQDYLAHIKSDEVLTKRINFGKATIIDLGCGTGRMTEFMVTDFGRVIGLDISREMVKQARKRVIGAEFIETDGQTIPLPDESVDLVFSYLVFQHIKTKEMVEKNFEEVYRVLKPKGIFKVRIRSDKLESLEPWWAGVSYTEQSIGKLCQRLKFKILRTEPVGDYGFWVWLKK